MSQLFQFGERLPQYDVLVLNEREARAGARILFAFALVAFMTAMARLLLCVAEGLRRTAPGSYQPFVLLTIFTTDSVTGTSISTPATVASAAPELNSNRRIAADSASSKKLLAPISADGHF